MTNWNNATVSEKDWAKEIVSKFATLLDKTDENIVQEDIRWLNHEDIYADNLIPWFKIESTWKKDTEIPNTDKFFDWWHREYVWDGMRSSLIEYRKWDIACYYFDSFEQEVPFEIINREWDYDSNEYNTLRNEFYETVTYEISLSCAKTPEWVYNYDSMYLDAISLDNWFKWTASIRWTDLVIFNPNWIMLQYYFSDIKKNNNTIIFTGYQNESTLTKEECIDYKWDRHEYSIETVIIWDTVYKWCADNANTDFIIWEQWTTKTFNKKSWLKTDEWTDTYYEIMGIIWNYMQVSIGKYIENEYVRSQLILEHTDNGRNILYEWDYDISDEKCEELNQYDNNLMEMFFLQNCPRG